MNSSLSSSTSVDDGLAMICRAWASFHPGEAKAFAAHMKEARELSYKQNGVSRNGSIRKYGEIPASLYTAITEFLGNEQWTSDRKLLHRVFSQFRAGLINPRSVQ